MTTAIYATRKNTGNIDQLQRIHRNQKISNDEQITNVACRTQLSINKVVQYNKTNINISLFVYF